MSKPFEKVARKNSLRGHKEETLRGSSLKSKRHFFWVTLKLCVGQKCMNIVEQIIVQCSINIKSILWKSSTEPKYQNTKSNAVSYVVKNTLHFFLRQMSL